MAGNYRFSRQVPGDPAGEYVSDKLFTVDRRHNALVFNSSANNYVRTVTDDGPDNWTTVRDQVAAGLFGYIPGVHQAYVRDALRPAMRGGGRTRNR